MQNQYIYERTLSEKKDNAPIHKSKVLQVALQTCDFEEINYPSYRPELGLSDYHLLTKLKKKYEGVVLKRIRG